MQDPKLEQLIEDVWETVQKLDFHHTRLEIAAALVQCGLKIYKENLPHDEFKQLTNYIVNTTHLL
jgi:hypothetical protein